MSTSTRPFRAVAFGWRSAAVVACLLAMAAASWNEPAQQAAYEWVEITYRSGTTVEVAVFKPEAYFLPLE